VRIAQDLRPLDGSHRLVKPVALPALRFGGPVISATEALSLDSIPDRPVLVGAGYMGLELGTAFAKMGTKVTEIEALTSISRR
jgi:dihydrolipoamide dehydrogenase